jgi:hypothetical protein
VRKLLAHHRVPYFPLDAIMIATGNRPGIFDVHHGQSPLVRSAALWPLTEDVVKTVAEQVDSYAFEGDYILPSNLKEFADRNPRYRFSAVFLGYADADPVRKLEAIRRFALPADWTRGRSDARLADHIKTHIAFSAAIREQCMRLGFPYIEAGHDFDAYLDDALKRLVTQA